MNVLGLNLWSHDTAACLISNGVLVCAVEQERFCGEKHTKEFPINAINAVLSEGNIRIEDVDVITVGWNFKRLVRDMYLSPALGNDNELNALPSYFPRLQNYLDSEKVIRERLSYWSGQVVFYDHHLAHSRFAQYASNETDAVSIVIDGYGDKETVSIFQVINGRHEHKFGCNFPNSLGLVYSSITKYLGFRTNCDEGIIMGLAAYGDPFAKICADESSTYLDHFREFLKIDAENIFSVNVDYFPFGNYRQGLYSRKFIDLFGNEREHGDPLTEHHKNIAAALQHRTEEVLEHIVCFSEKFSTTNKFLLSGGVALNCVANAKLVSGSGKISRRSIFVPPNPGDAGVAIGAALQYCHEQGISVGARALIGLGPHYGVAHAIDDLRGDPRVKVTKPKDIHSAMAERLKAGKILALLEGGSEFGPRALGHRSIITAPFPHAMKDYLNARVKFREDFRPFAPIVRQEEAVHYFEIDYQTPYMMHAVNVRPEMKEYIAATVHVDGSCRVQTVSKNESPFLYELITSFKLATGIGVLLNTSFNVKGQPIVETPEVAVSTFLSTNIDSLVMPPYILDKIDLT